MVHLTIINVMNIMVIEFRIYVKAKCFVSGIMDWVKMEPSAVDVNSGLNTLMYSYEYKSKFEIDCIKNFIKTQTRTFLMNKYFNIEWNISYTCIVHLIIPILKWKYICKQSVQLY